VNIRARRIRVLAVAALTLMIVGGGVEKVGFLSGVLAVNEAGQLAEVVSPARLTVVVVESGTDVGTGAVVVVVLAVLALPLERVRA